MIRSSKPASPRFEFGENWRAFLGGVDEAGIDQAVVSLRQLLKLDSLSGQTFLDIGCGSGLFSLAAVRLGAEVVSIDYDRQCVACAAELKRRFAPRAGGNWQIQPGDVLDREAMATLGRLDVVYSWGVLHHTGNMWRAIEHAADRVAPGGRLAIAIYNDQGGGSRRWLTIKNIYHRLPMMLRPVWVTIVAGMYEMKFAAARLAGGRNPLPFADWRSKRNDRGMNVWRDWVDWVGGLPFEVASPESIILPRIERDFRLVNLSTVGSGWGCNQYVFVRNP